MRGRLARILFVAAYVGLALYAWSSWAEAQPQYKNEVLIKVTLILYFTTLPSSLLVGLIYAGLVLVIPIDHLDAGAAFLNWLCKTWGPLAIAGYLQWFVLLPWLWRKWNARRARGTAPPV